MRIDFLPAGHGDCLLIEYGDTENPSRVLIDGGTQGTFPALHARIAAMPADQRHFELFILTHVDADHVEGAVRILHDTSLGVTFGDIWFNGWKHLDAAAGETLGGVSGEMFSALIEERGHPWNAAFGGKTVQVIDGEPLPTATLPGGMELTLLSPKPPQLVKMRAAWETEVRKAGLEPGVAAQALKKLEKTKRLHGLTLGDDEPTVEQLAASRFDADSAPANGSSICVLAEADGKRVLLTGDAYSPVTQTSIEALLESTGATELKLDLCKLAHHGSASNTSVDLIKLLRCPTWVFSTNGAYFNHPDPEAVARVIVHGGRKPQLVFNYRSKLNERWDDVKSKREHGYTAVYPEGDDGIVVEV